MRGISQLWRWMLAEGIIVDMKQTDEIVGSDSSAGISILKRNGVLTPDETRRVEGFLLAGLLQVGLREDHEGQD